MISDEILGGWSVLKNGPTPDSFCFFVLFKYNGIQTQLVGVEGEHADHLTSNTTANGGQTDKKLIFFKLKKNKCLKSLRLIKFKSCDFYFVGT